MTAWGETLPEDGEPVVVRRVPMDPEPRRHSPVPVKRATSDALDLDWPAAQRAVMDGQRVTRREWANQAIYMLLADGRLTIRLPRSASGPLPRLIDGDMGLHDMIVSDGDLLATDWTVVA